MPRTKTAKSALKPASEVMLRELKKYEGKRIDISLLVQDVASAGNHKLLRVDDDGLVVYETDLDSHPTVISHIDYVVCFSVEEK